jgi:gamma-glutamyltranspeptidase/glutathione hydrolase
VNRRRLYHTATAATLALGLLRTLPLGAQTPDTRVRSHRPEVPGVHGLVTTGGQPLAAMAGARILLNGGTAIDAAVAVLATLNVVDPVMSSIGGNGFLTYFDKASGKVYSLNMTGGAPRALRSAEMTAETLGEGVKAGAVPGLFGGWIAMLDRFGTQRLSTVLQPAIDYAANGHPVDKHVVRAIRGRQEFFRKFPTSAAIFLPGGNVPDVGAMLRNPDLATTLRKVSAAEREALRRGRSRSAALKAAHDRFYKGDIAQEMVRFFQANGGLLTAEDFAAYAPQWTEPVHTTYRGYDVYSSPSTSRGGIEVAMQLNLLEGFDLTRLAPDSPALQHLMIEAIKVAKSDVYKYVADPKFTTIPLEGMLSKRYAAERRQLIDRDKAIAYPAAGTPGAAAASKSSALRNPADPTFDELSLDGHTVSFSVVDRAGNAAVITPTLGSGFGTGVVVGSTGFLLNNGMRIGSTSPYPDDVNYVRPGQIPILNNSPIVVLKDGKLLLTLGSPGGETIGQTQFQTLVNVLDYNMPIQEAIEAPRFSLSATPNFYRANSPITVRIEGRFPGPTLEALKAMGHTLDVVPGFGSIGNMQGILVNLKTGTMTAGADPRLSGYAIGW